MVTAVEKHTIKTILQSPVKSVFQINKQVSYKEVHAIWNLFIKQQNNFTFSDLTIQYAFEFHSSHSSDHIVMYYNGMCSNCLILSKINGKYINALIPDENILKQHNKSFIAIFSIED
tara:strand:+ start:240 stop:590 length:351 start_codon:yes stop_codon:yes gene_type:complete